MNCKVDNTSFEYAYFCPMSIKKKIAENDNNKQNAKQLWTIKGNALTSSFAAG